jgi:signal transduction histidine kinase
MRWRLAAALVGIVALVLIVQDVPLGFHLARVERDRLQTGLERDAYVLSGRAEDALEGSTTVEQARLDDVVADYRARTGATVVITDAAGRSIATGGPGTTVGDSYANRPEIAEALAGRFAAGERQSRTLGEPLVYVALPVRSGDRVLGAVRLAYPASAIDHRVAARLRTLLVAAAVSLAAAAVVAVTLAATISRPLRRLRSATDGLASGDLSARASTDSGPPEVRALATSFDAMAGRIEQMVAAQRAFAGDASHQLRTPLTALRLRIDQAAALVADDPVAARRHLEAAAEEIDRLGRLTDGLLTLARADAEAEVVAVDVAAVARERAEEWLPLADEGGVALVVETPDAAAALAVMGAVEQIVDNYVANALDVAPAGSTLRISVAADRARVELHVVDEGPGLSDEQRARAFDRFWQAGGQTGRDQTGGTGLGLAITQRLATASGAKVELRRAPGGGIDAVASFHPATGRDGAAAGGYTTTGRAVAARASLLGA